MAELTADHIGRHRYENVDAHVVSAMELNKSQASTLEDVLFKKLNKRVKVLLSTDPSVIGGLYIEVDGFIIDRTIKKQLGDLRDAVKKGDTAV